MLQEHAKIVQFVSLANEINGRKKMQKMVYILKKMNFPFAEKYELHMYGPYSEELTLRVEELCEMGFLAERFEDKGSYKQYCYQVTEEGSKFLTTADAPKTQLSDCIGRLNEKSSRFLELVSTLLFFDQLDKEDQIAKVRIVKNKLNFTDQEFDQAFAFIEEMQVTSVS
ncbi:hypothetical protein SporoP37_11650 [Sporosarcina sp. P37]|uniref:YwgA family protein n=1 Tax=unclassified Sporosarcina TaxID=2647733 RepID=UPI0009C17E14|nr:MULTISPECIES: hypothetical protein [unclassified Sporosarcina]ARD48739.1 hypothetical protein SporoP33_11235 [Sporosarcina sp. P33]ARK25246.1 hypothetical protein SporoP37_11650 [Sporosarcina sp. P37]PID17878.1 hypothetical protein CSV62_11455 [Sporosarcina sp. P35]